MPNYKTYDPETEGYGNSTEWRDSFKQRMGYDEAVGILNENDPYQILGVSKNATFPEIKIAFRKLAMIHHPDKNPDNQEEATEMMKKLTAAYVVLEKRFNK